MRFIPTFLLSLSAVAIGVAVWFNFKVRDRSDHDRVESSVPTKKTDAETAGYVARMKTQYDHTDEKRLISEALDKTLGARRFANAVDIGPGPGEVTRPLYDRAYHLTLVELNKEYRVPLSAQFPRATVVIDSIHNLTYSKSFDAILFSHGFYYLDEAEWLPFAQRLMTYLKPGGSLFIVMNNDEGDGARIIRSFWAKYPEMKTHSFPPREAFKSELSKLGTLTTHCLTYHWRFRAEETVNVLGSGKLAIPSESQIQKIETELRAYAGTLTRDGADFVMNVGAEIVEIRSPNC